MTTTPTRNTAVDKKSIQRMKNVLRVSTSEENVEKLFEMHLIAPSSKTVR